MKKVTYYVAYDGTQFESEEECRDHEKKSLIFYDIGGYRTHGICNASIVVVSNLKLIEENNLANEYGYCHFIDRPGMYVYCETFEQFIRVDAAMAEIITQDILKD